MESFIIDWIVRVCITLCSSVASQLPTHFPSTTMLISISGNFKTFPRLSCLLSKFDSLLLKKGK